MLLHRQPVLYLFLRNTLKKRKLPLQNNLCSSICPTYICRYTAATLCHSLEKFIWKSCTTNFSAKLTQQSAITLFLREVLQGKMEIDSDF